MNFYNKTTVLFVLIMSLFFSSGCESKSNIDITIFELNSMARYNVSTNGGYRENLLSVNEAQKCFYTFQGVGGNFKLRTRNFSGKEIKSKQMPLFSESYAGGNNIAVSLDGNNLAYFDQNSKAINLYSFNSKTSKTLLPNASEYGLSIKKIEFISPDDIIIVLEDDEAVGRNNCQIIKYNIPSKTQSLLSKPSKLLRFVHAFSSDLKYLAYVNNDTITILDLNSKSKSSRDVGNFQNTISAICWNSDGDKIGYIEGENIKVFDLVSKQQSTVKSFTGGSLCYELKFVDDKHLIYLLGIPGKGRKSHYMNQPLRVLDISTGKDVKTINNFKLNGDLFVVEDGKRIIGEVGF